MNEQSSHPFKTLGTHLKYLREQLNESLAEVSGAVEIDMEVLERIEQGKERPSEDILMLLISHFDMPDYEAIQLWNLAGYERQPQDKANIAFEDMRGNSGKPVVMLVAFDNRPLYTDGVTVNCNQAGVTMHFTQAVTPDQSMPVARVGMSYEQAERVLQTLQQALLHAKYLRGPRQLPSAEEKNPPTTD